jgi:signal transduction histidine kinase
MSTLLARWLTEHRTTLLPRWLALTEDYASEPSGNGHSSDELADGDVVIHPAERVILLTSIYDGLIAASNQDYGPLDECLGLLRAFRAHHGEDELPKQLALTSQLRRAVWERLLEPSQKPARRAATDWGQIVAELDTLLEYTSVTLARQWVASAEVVQRELSETRMLVESLYHDAEATDRTTLQISILNEIAQGLSSSMNRTQQLAIVGDKLSAALGVGILSIWLCDEAHGELLLAREWAVKGEGLTEQLIDLTDEHDLLAGAFRTGALLVALEVEQGRQGAWYRPDHAVLAVPMLAQGQPIGVIALQSPTGEALLDRSQQDFVRSAASQAAIALENTRLYDEVLGFNSVLEQRIAERTSQLQLERDMLETLHQIALETSSTLDRDSLLTASLSALAQLTGVQHGSIMLIEPEIEHLVDAAVLGSSSKVGYTRFAIGQGVVGWVAQHKKPAVVPDVSKDPRWVALPDAADGVRKTGGSMIAVPLVAHHQLLGVLLLSHDDVGYFTEDHMRLLSASADQIAIGINNAQLYAELEKELLHRSEMLGRQESEASQSQAILQSLSDGVLVCGEDGSVLTANLAVERMLDRSIEELVIWNLPELLRRLLGKRANEVPVEDLLARPLNARGEPQTFATTFELGTKVISVMLGPVLNSKETLIGAVAVFRDITREVESDRLKTEFIGTVSHELRTPMTSIKGFTQLLAMGSLGPINDTQKEFLQIIQTNSERMISIINDLLDITKIETGSVELDLRSLHLAETLSNVMMELKEVSRARDHELSISIPPGLPLLRADAKRFNQILWNLLSNAIKYTPRGGKIAFEAREATLEVVPEELREGLKPVRYALIEVRDTGVGIAREEYEQIFDRFYRTENPLKVEAGGTGLGLSLVRPLIQLFGGRIWVRSTIGEGSTFSFVIPAA